MTELLYRYPNLISGIFVKRYKRFFVDVELASGEVVTAHCPNTGSMTGVSKPGSMVQISASDNPKRKLAYTLELIQVKDESDDPKGVVQSISERSDDPKRVPRSDRLTWVGVNTALPNRVVKLALEKHLFPQLGEYTQIRSEVPYGKEKKSRVDFVLTEKETERPIYLEVKNTTLAEGKLALFPDTETTRGQKHLIELTALLPETRAVMLYFINRGDCTEFSPGDTTDPKYGELLREGMKSGLEVLPCRFEITPEGIRYLGLAECSF